MLWCFLVDDGWFVDLIRDLIRNLIGGLLGFDLVEFLLGVFDGFEVAFFVFGEGAVHGGEAGAGVSIDRGVMEIGGGDAGDGAGLGLKPEN